MTLKRFKFENLAKQTMSEFFDAENIIKKEILDIREEYEYHLNTPLTLSRVMNILEEQDDIFILYNFVPSKSCFMQSYLLRCIQARLGTYNKNSCRNERLWTL